MSVTFTKLFTSITESTVWFEPDSTRLVWITMLAMADRKGRVFASTTGLAHRARVTEEQLEAALECFLSPDTKSRTKDHEGRRIVEIDGGWHLLNHEKYRSIRDDETIKESKRKYAAKKRAEWKEVEKVEQSRPPSTAIDRIRDNAEAEAEAEAEASSSTEKAQRPDTIRSTMNRIMDTYNESIANHPSWNKCSKLPAGENGRLLEARAKEEDWVSRFPEQMRLAVQLDWLKNRTLSNMLRPDRQRQILDGEWKPSEGSGPYSQPVQRVDGRAKASLDEQLELLNANAAAARRRA